ncbi:MAG: MarR family winged helix-turn-helix transcriptional regulator [Candidatus Binatia bacterium]
MAQKRKNDRREAGARSEPPLLLIRELPTYEALQERRRLYPEIDPESLAAHLALFHVVSHIVAAVGPHFARHRLSKGKFAVMMMLLFEGGGQSMSPSDLAGKTGVTRATITGLLDGLERDGLVKREPSADDRRKLLVRLTPRAERLLRDFLPGHFRRIAALMSGLTRAEKRTLVDLLAKVRSGLPAMEEVA